MDQGNGFDLHDSKIDDGFGLVGMRERASLVGGSLCIDTQPGHGTLITLNVPLA